MSSRDIDNAAAEWLARLDRQPSAELEEQIASWRAADPRHEVAYLRLKTLWQRLARSQALRPPHDQKPDPDLLCVEGVSEEQPAQPRRAPDWMRHALVAGVACVVAGMVYAIVGRVSESHFQTGIGGFERVVLPDGSIMELNTRSEVRASFNDARRAVELVAGEASFSVVHDAQRPFVVTVGKTSVRAVGTRFNVRRMAQGAEVLVTEGKVAVGPAELLAASASVSSASADVPIVSAWQVASVSKGRVSVRQESRDDVESELAWQAGMLRFKSEPLARVVAEFNRYNARQLVIADAQLSDLEIGGYFKATNLDTFVKVLDSSFGVDVDVDGNRILLRRAAPAQ